MISSCVATKALRRGRIREVSSRGDDYGQVRQQLLSPARAAAGAPRHGAAADVQHGRRSGGIRMVLRSPHIHTFMDTYSTYLPMYTTLFLTQLNS